MAFIFVDLKSAGLSVPPNGSPLEQRYKQVLRQLLELGVIVLPYNLDELNAPADGYQGPRPNHVYPAAQMFEDTDAPDAVVAAVEPMPHWRSKMPDQEPSGNAEPPVGRAAKFDQTVPDWDGMKEKLCIKFATAGPASARFQIKNDALWCSIDKDDPAFAQGVRALRNAVIWRNHRAGYSKLAVRHCAIGYVIEFTNAIGTGRSIQNYMKNWAAFIHKPVTQALNYIGCMVLVTAASGPVIRQDRAFLESLTKQPAQVGHFYHIQANATNAAPPPLDVDGIVGGLLDLIVYLEAVQKVLNAITKSRETGGEFNISWLISQAYTSR